MEQLVGKTIKRTATYGTTLRIWFTDDTVLDVRISTSGIEPYLDVRLESK